MDQLREESCSSVDMAEAIADALDDDINDIEFDAAAAAIVGVADVHGPVCQPPSPVKRLRHHAPSKRTKNMYEYPGRLLSFM